MNLIKGNFTKLAFTLFLFAYPLLSLAQIRPSCNEGGGKICNPLESLDTVEKFIQVVLEGAIKIAMPVIALAIIYSGFLFVFARGNSEKLTKARQTLMYTLIGAAILLGAWAIARLIAETVSALK